ncbi:hypothetical protein D3C83_206320 [compost metagenome]
MMLMHQPSDVKASRTSSNHCRYLETGPRYVSSHRSDSVMSSVRGTECPPGNTTCRFCAEGVPSSEKNGFCDDSSGK